MLRRQARLDRALEAVSDRGLGEPGPEGAHRAARGGVSDPVSRSDPGLRRGQRGGRGLQEPAQRAAPRRARQRAAAPPGRSRRAAAARPAARSARLPGRGRRLARMAGAAGASTSSVAPKRSRSARRSASPAPLALRANRLRVDRAGLLARLAEERPGAEIAASDDRARRRARAAHRLAVPDRRVHRGSVRGRGRRRADRRRAVRRRARRAHPGRVRRAGRQERAPGGAGRQPGGDRRRRHLAREAAGRRASSAGAWACRGSPRSSRISRARGRTRRGATTACCWTRLAPGSACCAATPRRWRAARRPTWRRWRRRSRGCSRRVAPLVLPGGSLIYSVCTFDRQECEAVIEGFLRSHPDVSNRTSERTSRRIAGGIESWHSLGRAHRR